MDRNAPLRKIIALAPVLSLVLVVGLSFALPTFAAPDGSVEARRAEIAVALEETPWLIGPWVGEIAQVPREAQKLLRSNSILSRVYSRRHGPQVHVLLVHCDDARDMLGHYPPVCYPSSGYVAIEGETASDLELEVSGRSLPVQTYAFERMRDRTETERIRVFNAFILPDGRVSREIDDINQQSERAPIARLGVAQLQLITPASVPLDEAVASANEILGGMTDLFEALRVGEGATDAQ